MSRKSLKRRLRFFLKQDNALSGTATALAALWGGTDQPLSIKAVQSLAAAGLDTLEKLCDATDQELLAAGLSPDEAGLIAGQAGEV